MFPSAKNMCFLYFYGICEKLHRMTASGSSAQRNETKIKLSCIFFWAKMSNETVCFIPHNFHTSVCLSTIHVLMEKLHFKFFLIYFLIKCKRYKFYIIYIYCLIIYLCNAFFYNITIYIFILFFYKMFILHYFFL